MSKSGPPKSFDRRSFIGASAGLGAAGFSLAGNDPQRLSLWVDDQLNPTLTDYRSGME